MSSHRRRAKRPLDHEPAGVTFARTSAGLTKTELASQLGVSLSLVSEIEAGTRNATPAMQLRMARILRCPPVVLRRRVTEDLEDA